MNLEALRIYSSLHFPVEKALPARPYTFINMVVTIDGKSVSGERGEPVHDLGSEVDHFLMRRIEEAADAVLIGAGSQRSTPKITYGQHLVRIVATRSGNLLYPSSFFDEAPEKAYVLCPESCEPKNIPRSIKVIHSGKTEMVWEEALRVLRKELGIERLLVEGGSDINGQLLGGDNVDELFLTIAPKVKLGENIPTLAGGVSLPRGHLLRFSLLEHHVVGDEVFLRYRRE